MEDVKTRADVLKRWNGNIVYVHDAMQELLSTGPPHAPPASSGVGLQPQAIARMWSAALKHVAYTYDAYVSRVSAAVCGVNTTITDYGGEHVRDDDIERLYNKYAGLHIFGLKHDKAAAAVLTAWAAAEAATMPAAWLTTVCARLPKIVTDVMLADICFRMHVHDRVVVPPPAAFESTEPNTMTIAAGDGATMALIPLVHVRPAPEEIGPRDTDFTAIAVLAVSPVAPLQGPRNVSGTKRVRAPVADQRPVAGAVDGFRKSQRGAKASQARARPVVTHHFQHKTGRGDGELPNLRNFKAEMCRILSKAIGLRGYQAIADTKSVVANGRQRYFRDLMWIHSAADTRRSFSVVPGKNVPAGLCIAEVKAFSWVGPYNALKELCGEPERYDTIKADDYVHVIRIDDA